MAKAMKRVTQTKKLPAKQPTANAVDRSAAKTSKSIFDRADTGNRKLSKG